MQSTNSAHGKYLKRVALTASFLLLAVVAINRIVDPFALHDGPTISGFNAAKPFYFTNLRTTKAVAVKRLRPTAVVLGSSRAELGIDPSHPGWGSEPVYNLALSGTTIYESWRYLQHAQAVQPLDQVVLAVDLLMFNAGRKFDDGSNSNPMFDERRLAVAADGSPGEWFAGDVLAAYFSLDALLKSLQTPLRQGGIPEYAPDGTRNTRSIPLEAIGGHRQAFLDNELDKFTTIYTDFAFASETVDNFAVFREIVRFAHEHDIDLRIAISPCHARMFETIAVRGLWERFEEWKREMVRVNVEESARSGGEPFPLWDFSGYNAYTTEPVPPLGDLESQMTWYFESSHYTRELGNLMLDRIFDHREPGREPASEFGVRLESPTIEAHLRRMRENQRAWRAAFPEDAAELKALKTLEAG